MLDLLPDRRAETVAAWLVRHPSVQVVCRDRYAALADAANQGAPQALQVADRFHLVQNLGDTLLPVLQQQKAALQAACCGTLRRFLSRCGEKTLDTLILFVEENSTLC